MDARLPRRADGRGRGISSPITYQPSGIYDARYISEDGLMTHLGSPMALVYLIVNPREDVGFSDCQSWMIVIRYQIMGICCAYQERGLGLVEISSAIIVFTER